jgi:TonB-linked SusC/RagA family outer membrane protein
MKKNAHRIDQVRLNQFLKIFLMFKFILILVMITTVQVFAKGYSQSKINVNFHNVTLKGAFKEIEKKSEYKFLYSDNVVSKNDLSINLDVTNASLDETMAVLLANTNLVYKLSENNLVILYEKGSAALALSVTGKVTDENDLPMPGVTVKVKGTAITVTTNVDGKYALNLPDGNTSNVILVFSFVGYATQEVPLKGNAILNLQLKAVLNSLDEVVVVGYGTLTEKEVSSAITHVAAKDLLTIGGNGALMSLQGKVAGLSITNTASADPNSSPSIQLRGVSSRSAGLGPLYVIDGIPGGNIDNLAQNDIASIDILKSGAASAIYGTRGSNGVILVTTKKGTSQTQTNYSDYFSADIPIEKLKVLSAAQFLANNRGFNYGGSTDWLSAIIRPYEFSQRHDLSVSGGNGKTNYYISADYRNSDGVDLRASKREYGARANITHTPENNLYTLTFSIAPRYLITNNSNQGEYAQALTLNPTEPIRDPTNPLLYYFAKGIPGAFNPVEDAKTVLSGGNLKYLDMSASVKLNILKNWNTLITLSEVNSDNFTFGFTPSTNTLIINGNGYSTANRGYSVNDTKNLEWITNYRLNYKQHSINLLAGYSYQYNNSQNVSASNAEFPNDALTYNNLGAGLYDGVAGQYGIGSDQQDSRLIAFFGRLNYSYNNEVYITASLRHEGSSVFGQDHKWGNFPAVSAAWDLSRHSFMKNFGWIDNLKLKADFGITGNQSIGNYNSLATYAGYGYYLYDGTYYQDYGPSRNTNYDLHWETTTSYNVAVDFSLLKGRLSGSLTYYTRKNTDLLGSYNVPQPPNVQGTIYANVGSMKNSGVEVQITGAPIRSKDFNYEVSFAGASLANTFVSFSNQVYQGQPYVDGAGLGAPGTPGTLERLQEGKRIGSFFMLKSAGYDNLGRLLVYNAAGQIIPGNQASTNDKQFVGNGLPRFTASLGNTFKYKNWDASVYLRGVFDYSIFNTNSFYFGTPATSGTNILASAYNGNKYSKLTSGATVSVASDYFLEPGDFVKLDNVTIGYTLRAKSKYLRSVRMFITGRNLHTFTKYSGGDPETVNTNGLYPGVNTSFNYYPTTLQVLGGVQVSL